MTNPSVEGSTAVFEEVLIPPLIRYFQSLGYVILREFRVPGAVPDLLAVSPNKERVAERMAKGQAKPLTRQIYWETLSLIPDKESGDKATIQAIATHLGLSINHVKKQ